MMIKNSIVLIDEINENLAAGIAPYESIIEAAVSRLRPVVLATATTVLGVIPLLQDVFWIGLLVPRSCGEPSIGHRNVRLPRRELHRDRR